MTKQLKRTLNFTSKLTKEMQNTLNQSSAINVDGISRNENFRPNNYIYKMIETMLPKAMVDDSKPLKPGEKRNLRMLEL